MVVAFCYFQKESYKVLKFHVSNSCFFETSASVFLSAALKVKIGIVPEIMKDTFERYCKSCSLWLKIPKISWPKNLTACAK